MTTLTTGRLILRPLIDADAPAYAAMRYHPDVARWLAPATGDAGDAAVATIAYFAECRAKDGHAPWGMFLKTADGGEGRLIGQGGLRVIPEFDDRTELLYALHPDVHGKGYASEMGRAALRHGFEDRGLDLVFAITRPDNAASRAVMARLGMRHTRAVVYTGIDAVWYEIDAATWRAGVSP
ncbi:MAG: GNAT family N-acetyltransferase [Rhodospirillales bacterium]|nr:GNAT family N-acetyltransferase [Rhodospirillales bacterium]